MRATYKGDTATVTLRLARGQNAHEPDLLLLLQTVSGRVLLKGVPVAGATVSLGQSGRNLQSVQTTGLGTYIFRDVSAGTYRITASRSGDTASLNVTVARGSKPDRARHPVEAADR